MKNKVIILLFTILIIYALRFQYVEHADCYSYQPSLDNALLYTKNMVKWRIILLTTVILMIAFHLFIGRIPTDSEFLVLFTIIYMVVFGLIKYLEHLNVQCYNFYRMRRKRSSKKCINNGI